MSRFSFENVLPIKHIVVFSSLLMLITYISATGVSASSKKNVIYIKTYTHIQKNGNADISAVLGFNSKKQYLNYKKDTTRLSDLFSILFLSRGASVLPAQDQLELLPVDSDNHFTLHTSLLGASVCKDNLWKFPLTSGENEKTFNSREVITSASYKLGTKTLIDVNSTYSLPTLANGGQVDASRDRITYRMPVSRQEGQPELTLQIDYHRRVMSCVYKLYANPNVDDGSFWLARTVIQNTGQVPVYNVSVNYSLGNDADHTIQDPFTVIMPGGEVVVPYYPLISSRVASFKSSSPAHLSLQCTYQNADGNTFTQNRTKLITILGINQFVNSNHPGIYFTGNNKVSDWKENNNNAHLLAAYITTTDDPVKMMAGYVSELAGGVAADDTPADAETWLKAAYNLELANHFVYQTPSSEGDEQDVKYPRDTIRAKSGTCIDLAILYSSLAESVGLHAYLMLVPGHCFSVIELPASPKSNQRYLYAVETTGLGGGNDRRSFQWAAMAGERELEQHFKDGRYYLIDISKEQVEDHIQPPNLPHVSANFLNECGIRRVSFNGGNQAMPQPFMPGYYPPQTYNPGNRYPNYPAHPAVNPYYPSTSTAPADPGTFTGHWRGSLSTIPFKLHIHEHGAYASGSIDLKMPDGSWCKGTFKKASISINNEFKVVCRINWGKHAYSIAMDGIRNGGIIQGTVIMIERGFLNMPIQTTQYNWLMMYHPGN